MSNAPQLVQKLWNYCNVLRDDGMSYGDYVEQLTYLLFLKMADERSKPPLNQPSPIPSEASIPLSWQISIGIIAVICGAAAWFLRLRSEREFQKRWNKK